MRVGVITWEKEANRPLNSCGSSRIRGRWLWEAWDEASEYMVGKPYDVLIFQKAFWEEMIDGFKGIKIFDECDPSFLERDNAFKIYDKCDAVVTSTQPLADYIKKLLPHKIVKCIPDRVALKEHEPVKKEHSSKLDSVVWFGYSGNFRYEMEAVKVLVRKGINVFMYAENGVAVDGVTWRKYNYETIHKDLIQYDAAIFSNDRANLDRKGAFKSNNKLTTCWALGIPVIQTPEDLERFQDPAERKKEAKNKLKIVKEKYDIRLSVEEYKELIQEIMAKK